MQFLGLMRVKTHERVIDEIKQNHEQILHNSRSRNSKLISENEELTSFKNTISRRARDERGHIAIEVENIERLRQEVLARLSSAEANMAEMVRNAKSLLNLTNGLSGRASDKET